MPTTPLALLLSVAKALASRPRLRILAALEGRELNVGQVAAVFGIACSTASEHLSELGRARLVIGRRDGHVTRYALGVDEEARGFVDVVLSALSTDPAVLSDRTRVDRLLALSHDRVGEREGGPLSESASSNASSARGDRLPGSTSRSKTTRQEVP